MQKQIAHSKKQSPFILSSFLQLLFCITIISAISCKKEDGKTNDQFVSCCIYDATIYKDGSRKIAFPTLVTDNGDGINDIFQIYNSAAVVNDTIVSLRIFDSKNVLIFESSLKAIKTQSQLWNGLINSGPDTGAEYRGTFSFECITRGPSGPAITINGRACIVADNCDVKEDNLNKCVFGTQHTGGGEFTPDLPSLEDCQ